MNRVEFVSKIKKALGLRKLSITNARVTSSPEGRLVVLLEVAPDQKQTKLVVQAVVDSMLDAPRKE